MIKTDLDESVVNMAEITNPFKFKQINCSVCDEDDARLVGYRAGKAHRSGQGTKTTIVRCLNCSHQYPNPMPFPVVDLDEIYVEPDEYFQRRDRDKKREVV